MFKKPDASNFSSVQFVYATEFENILGKIISCYQLMVKNEDQLPQKENDIRDVLVNKYINDSDIKKSLAFEYFVFSEVPETASSGRTDIRINHPNSVYNQNEEYYIIECKRLNASNQNGTTGLNAEYIKNGICRFTNNIYSSHYKVNGMVGFVTEDLDINNNVICINKLFDQFPDANTTQTLNKAKLNAAKGFEFIYTSTHKTKKNNPLKLYHLMLDCSS